MKSGQRIAQRQRPGLALGLGAFAVVGLGITLYSHGDHVSSRASARLADERSAAGLFLPEYSDVPLPEAQQKLLHAVDAARMMYRSAARKLQPDAIRPARAQEICRVLPLREARDWVGQLEYVATDIDNNPIVSIRIGRGVYASTWGNGYQVADPLLEPTGGTFKMASSMKTGQWVRFSGMFQASATDCLLESSRSTEASIIEPVFMTRFVSITAVR